MNLNLDFLRSYRKEMNTIDAYADEIDSGDKTHKTEYDQAMDAIVSNNLPSIKQTLKVKTDNLELEKAKSKYFMYNKILLLGAIIGIIVYLMILLIIYGNRESLTNYSYYAIGSSWIIIVVVLALIPTIINISRQHKRLIVMFIRMYLNKEE